MAAEGRTTLYVPRISTKHGEDVAAAYESLDDALMSVATYCADWWQEAQEWASSRQGAEEGSEPLPMPEDPYQRVRAYFELVEDEFHEIHRVELIPASKGE